MKAARKRNARRTQIQRRQEAGKSEAKRMQDGGRTHATSQPVRRTCLEVQDMGWLGSAGLTGRPCVVPTAFSTLRALNG